MLAVVAAVSPPFTASTLAASWASNVLLLLAEPPGSPAICWLSGFLLKDARGRRRRVPTLHSFDIGGLLGEQRAAVVGGAAGESGDLLAQRVGAEVERRARRVLLGLP